MPKGSRKAMTLRAPEDVAVALHLRADELGLSANTVVVMALRAYLLGQDSLPPEELGMVLARSA